MPKTSPSNFDRNPVTITHGDIELPVISDRQSVAWSWFDIVKQSSDSCRDTIIRRLKLQLSSPHPRLSSLATGLRTELDKLSDISDGTVVMPNYQLALVEAPDKSIDFQVPDITLTHPILPEGFCLAAIVQRIPNLTLPSQNQLQMIRKVINQYSSLQNDSSQPALMDVTARNFQTSNGHIYFTDIDPLFKS